MLYVLARARVTRNVCEKVAQNVAKSISCENYTQRLPWKKSSPITYYGSYIYIFTKTARSKQSPNRRKIHPIWSPWLWPNLLILDPGGNWNLCRKILSRSFGWNSPIQWTRAFFCKSYLFLRLSVFANYESSFYTNVYIWGCSCLQLSEVGYSKLVLLQVREVYYYLAGKFWIKLVKCKPL
jgi:hypothetical protein